MIILEDSDFQYCQNDMSDPEGDKALGLQLLQ
jgi:hypothetical protein